MRLALLRLVLGVVLPLTCVAEPKPEDSRTPVRWPRQKANEWYAKQPWLVGCNFIPSTAINQLEMWQLDTFDPATIDSVLIWDLYNEPGNEGQGSKSLPLLVKTFQWAREVNPTQPLTAGVWTKNNELNDFQEAVSDIITFHNYSNADSLAGQINNLKRHGRPVICTEWLRRGNSDVATHLPIFKKERVGCYNWGLVMGKTQTIYPWGSPKDAPEPKVWFHDLLRKDGTPFDAEEVALFRKLTAKQ